MVRLDSVLFRFLRTDDARGSVLLYVYVIFMTGSDSGSVFLMGKKLIGKQ